MIPDAVGETNQPEAHLPVELEGTSTGDPVPDPTAGIYRLLVETVREYAIFALDPEGRVMTWNRGAERFKGYTPEEVIGKHFSIFYSEADRAAGKPEKALARAAEQGMVEDEGWRVRKDGSRFWAAVVITALHGPAGELVGFAKVTRDMTERRRVEETLRQSEERFRLLVQSVRDYGIFMLDPTGRVVSWNEGAERIKGYAPDEVIGKHFSIFYPDEDLAWGKPAMELRVAAKEGSFEDEGWRLRKDGTPFWANVVITALRNHEKQLLGFVKVTRDLTERRAAEDRAIADARRVAEAESANRAKSEFLTAMSHELRTPLNAIGGYTDILLLGIHGELNGQQQDDLQRIRRSQQHLLGIINDLLNFSRIEAGRVAYDLKAVSVHSLLDAVRLMVEPLAAAKGVHLEWEDVNPELALHADPGKVEQILLNLLGNAVKFTEAGGMIRTMATAGGGDVLLSITDTGVGISAEKLQTIFEPFVQVGRSFASGHEGVGLGLAISRELARAMSGDLRVESVPGSGSTFTLLLPRTGLG